MDQKFFKKKNIIYLIIKDKKFIGYIRLEYKKKFTMSLGH